MTQQGIEVFLAVARLGSVSAAAQALYITQPAVSRHLRALEEDLGCPLFLRGRGKRQVELTRQGREFVQVAEKWRILWQEARDVTAQGRTRALRVASVGSLSTYLLPPVFRDFMEGAPGRALDFHHYHSWEAYDYIAQGLTDIALISDHRYHPQVETIPAFRSAMVLVTGPELDWPETVHPSALEPGKELRLPWNPEYDLWHSFWFSTAESPWAVLDQMSLLEDFFSWGEPGIWAIAPAVASVPLSRKLGLTIRSLDSGPAAEIIYYLRGPHREQALTTAFLACLERELAKRPEVESLLRAAPPFPDIAE